MKRILVFCLLILVALAAPSWADQSYCGRTTNNLDGSGADGFSTLHCATAISDTKIYRATPISSAGAITALKVYLTTAVATGSYTFTIMKSTDHGANWANTDATFSISSGTSGSWTGSVSIATGDLIILKHVGASTPTATMIAGATWNFAPTTANETMLFNVTDQEIGGAGSYFRLSGYRWDSTAATCYINFPVAGTVKNLVSTLNNAPGTAHNRVFTFWNGPPGSVAGSTLTVTHGAADKYKEDKVNTASVAQNDLAYIKEDSASTPDSSFAYAVAVTFVASGGDAGKWLLPMTSTDFCSNSTTTYAMITGPMAANWDTYANTQRKFGAAFTITDMGFYNTYAPGASKSYLCSLYQNGAADGTIKITDTAAVSYNATGTTAVADGDLLATQLVPTNTPDPGVPYVTYAANSNLPAITGTMAGAVSNGITGSIAGRAPHTLTTYYVSTTGSDSGTGAIGDPWLTMYKAFTTPEAGDTVYFRNGTYYAFTNIAQIVGQSASMLSGGPTCPVTFASYTGEAATITGLIDKSGVGNWTKVGATAIYYTDIDEFNDTATPVQVSEDGQPIYQMPSVFGAGTNTDLTGAGQWASSALGSGQNKARVWVWASDGANPGTHTLQIGPRYPNIFINNNANYITCNNLTFEGNYYVVQVGGDHVTFSGCTFKNYYGQFKVGYDAQTVNPSYLTIDNCKFTKWWATAIDVTGGDYCEIKNSEFYNTTQGAGVLLVKNQSANCTFHNNKIHDISFAANPYSWESGVFQLGGATYGGEVNEAITCSMYNNVIWNLTGANYTFLFGLIGAQGCSFYNNTAYNCALSNSVIRMVPPKSDSDCSAGWKPNNNSVENNIFWGMTVTDGYYLRQYWCNLGTFTCNYNLIDTATINKVQLRTSDVDRDPVTLANFTAVYGFEANKVTADPIFQNYSGAYNAVTDFKLKNTSPAKVAGTDVGLTADYFGTIYSGGFPIGADRDYASSGGGGTTLGLSLSGGNFRPRP